MLMTPPVAFDPALDRDARLAQLLELLQEQLRQGEHPNVDRVAAQHPDLAEELRQLWGAALLAEELARSSPVTLPPVPFVPPSLPTPPSFDQYELLEPIGRGAMGVVYKARQHGLNRIVALKMTLRGDLATAEDRARFRAEAQAAARLDHPNIVPVYEVGEADGQLYFSMKFIEGITLARRAAQGPLPPREAARLLAIVARAVHYAHEKGVLHRDLKPSNVLLDSQGQPHVSDFGLAKRVGSDASLAPLTATNAILGTPSYLPPEQADARRGKLGPASDVYSLGAILYELLTGRPPFLAATPVDTVLLMLDQDPVPPRRLNPTVDRDLELICLKCLQKPPELRYPTAIALAKDLEAFLNGERPSVWSGSLRNLANHVFRETHHAPVLENWGTLWMWHSLVIGVMCLMTNALQWGHIGSHLPYLGLWSIGLVVWGALFWNIRKRGGPVQFVERQIAHVWAGAVSATIGVFLVEVLLPLPPLTLSPILAVIAGMVFIVKAGMLSGVFYFSAAAQFLTALLMAVFPHVGPLLFGLVTALCFAVPGYKYWRQRELAVGRRV
jgi:serine/threonine protein kinase